MTTIADVFRRYGSEYLSFYSDNILSSHKRALEDIVQCRTEILGGQVWLCENCEEYHYSYHSCKNRHCPRCQNDTSNEWLLNQKELLLPMPYFMVTFTIPEPLRKVIRRHQKTLLNILFRSSAESLQILAQDKRFVGGKIGMVGVLHTWSRALIYHPHIHYLLPGGGLTDNHRKWRRAKEKFLMRVEPLSIIFRGKFRDAVKKSDLFDQIPKNVWHKQWVVNIIPVGTGESALKYLAPYIFRVAISNRNIIRLNGDQITFRYKESATGKAKYQTLNVFEFIRRFLQHILPKGFMKVRYYGFFAVRKRNLLEIVKKLLGVLLSPKKNNGKTKPPRVMVCPTCGVVLILLGEMVRGRGPPV